MKTFLEKCKDYFIERLIDLGIFIVALIAILIIGSIYNLLFQGGSMFKTSNPEINNEVSQSQNYIQPVEAKVDNSDVRNDVPLISSRVTTTRYVEQDLGKDELGLPQTLKSFEVNTYLKNNSSKKIKKIIITVFFKNKYSDSQDYTSNSDSYSSEKEIEITSGAEANVTFTVFPKDDINMCYNCFKPEKIIYNDGSYVDLQ